jgi:hypothetical protein
MHGDDVFGGMRCNADLALPSRSNDRASRRCICLSRRRPGDIIRQRARRRCRRLHRIPSRCRNTLVCRLTDVSHQALMHDNPYQAPQTQPKPKPPTPKQWRAPSAKELLFLGFALIIMALGSFLRQPTSSRDVSALMVLLLSGACCIALAALVHFRPRH